MDTNPTTTMDTDPTPVPTKRSSRLRRLVAGACTLLAMSGIALGATASAASATASGAASGDFTGFCGYNRMRAEMPWYSTYYPGWSAAGAPLLFKYNATTRQFVLYQKGYAQSLTGWVTPGSEQFNNLSPGYYQVQFAVQWYYNGVLRSSTLVPAVHHIQDMANDVWWPYALNTQRYSTDSWCYEGN